MAREPTYYDSFDVRAFEQLLVRLRDGDATVVEPAIAFLEADTWAFRSGYAKGRAMRLLRHHHLDATQRRRLERVVLAHVDAADRMEFRAACDLARRLGPDRLRGPLVERLASGDRGRARRALVALSVLRSPRLSDRELTAARRVVVELGRGRDARAIMDRYASRYPLSDEMISYGMSTIAQHDERLLRRLALRFWSLDWEAQLLRLAEGDGPDRVAALKVLAALPRRHTAEHEQRFEAATARSRLLDRGSSQ